MTGKLAEALAAFQGEAPTVHKDKTATVPTKSGGSYKYAYADLADVAAAAYPILARHGLCFSCAPGLVDGKAVVRGILLHSSGESIEGALPLQGNTAQEIGSSLTYARRYLLGCLTGIVTDADDDGALATAAKRAPRPKPVEPSAPQHDPNDWPSKTAAAKTPEKRARDHMFALLGDVGLGKDRDAALALMSRVVGRPIASSTELSDDEVQLMIQTLRDWKQTGVDPTTGETS